MTERREQLSKIEARLSRLAAAEAQRIVNEVVVEIIEAHGFDLSRAKIIEENGALFLVQSLVDGPQLVKDEPQTQ